MKREEILTEAVSRLSVFRYWREEMSTQMIRVFHQIAPQSASEAKAKLFALVDHMTMAYTDWPGAAAFVAAYRLLHGETAQDQAAWVIYSQAEERKMLEEREPPALQIVEKRPPSVTPEKLRRKAFRLRWSYPETVGDSEWDAFNDAESVEEMQAILDRIQARAESARRAKTA